MVELQLLKGFTITHILDCLAAQGKNRVIAELTDDISPVFPYLNATLGTIIFNPGANSITIRREFRILTFYPKVAVMVKIDGLKDAEAQLLWFKDLCNETWAQRDKITPRYERRNMLGPLDVYLLLPRLNCRQCGEATCMAFAFGILLGYHWLIECPNMIDDRYAEGSRRLVELLGSEYYQKR